MDVIKEKLNQIKKLAITFFLTEIVGLCFFAPGVIIILISKTELGHQMWSDITTGYSLLGVSLFLLLIAFIAWAFVFAKALKVKPYLTNPIQFMSAIFFCTYVAHKIAVLKDKQEIQAQLDKQFNIASYDQDIIDLDDEAPEEIIYP
ncbi:hypothetical protein [Ureaplasma ceti]|uniref:Uncharacterized protein n=1 Tax=Ureaplasma ceti TaxID=3119530 RepID=A0ABP9U5M7_9BACT